MEEIDGEQRVVLWNTYWRYPSDEDAVFDGQFFILPLLQLRCFFQARRSYPRVYTSRAISQVVIRPNGRFWDGSMESELCQGWFHP
jgi:hypothetical protein